LCCRAALVSGREANRVKEKVWGVDGEPRPDVHVWAQSGAKLAFLALCLFLFRFSLVARIYADTPVRVGVYENAPLSFVDDQGRADGLVVDLLEAIAAEEGWQVEYVPCEQVFAAVQRGEADAGVANCLFGARSEADYGLATTPILFAPIELRLYI